MASKDKGRPRSRSRRRMPSSVVINVHATFNNTLLTVADRSGNVLMWESSGASGFKGNRKGTPYAAQLAAENLGKKAVEMGIASARIQLRGPGSGRESAVRALHACGINISEIRDVTPIPHNGCRPRKRRRG
ncbi:MAG: 30S ribosomal protein S11 [Betaproteobacteria bacterium]|nr:30S ribosomal protein S11 [Betaproteobacteria bacterium]